jgi:hypothetical protein
MAQHIFDMVDQLGVDGIHEAANHLTRGPRSTIRMATVIIRPVIRSARSNPAATPAAPKTTASEVKPSVRA